MCNATQPENNQPASQLFSQVLKKSKVKCPSHQFTDIIFKREAKATMAFVVFGQENILQCYVNISEPTTARSITVRTAIQKLGSQLAIHRSLLYRLEMAHARRFSTRWPKLGYKQLLTLNKRSQMQLKEYRDCHILISPSLI